MNTGIGDSFNLAHKLATLVHERDLLSKKQIEAIVKSYDEERRYVGNMTKNLALINYEKSLKVARMLNLDKRLADTLVSTVDGVLGYLPFVKKEAVVKFGLNLGLKAAEQMTEITNSG